MRPSTIARIHAALLYLYPPAFRREHGREMRQFVRAATAGDGGPRLFLRMLADLARSVPREWAHALVVRRGAPRAGGRRRHQLLAGTLHDVRFALRLLAGKPGFTAAAIVTLALGIGANTAMFSIADATLLRPVRIRDAGSLVVWSWTSSYPDYVEYTKRTDVFDGVAAAAGAGRVNLVADGAAELVSAAFVSGNAFDVLDVGVEHGRPIVPADDVVNAPLVGVLAHDYCRTRFAGDPAVVGRAVRVNGKPVTIVGVLRRGFRGISLSSNPMLYLPTAGFSQLQTGFFAKVDALSARGFVWLTVIGRLRPGVTAAQAAETMTVLYAQLHPPAAGQRTEPLHLETIADRALGRSASDLRAFVALLLGTVGITLLIGCANLANLLTARGAARRREMGVRLAVGATRGRVIRQLLAETIVLALAGGLAGLAVAWIGLRAIAHYQLPGGVVIGSLPLELNGAVAAAAFALSLVTGLLFGAAPAWRAARTDLLVSLRADTRPATGGGALRGGLLAAQVTLSLVLLAGAGLFAASLSAALDVDPGFDARGVVSASTATGLARYDEARARRFYADAVARVAALPQVEAAAWASMMPTRTSWVNQTTIEGYQQQPGEDVKAQMSHVGPGYFRAMGTRVCQGREFTPRDSASAAPVAVINEAMARKYWAGRSALGGRFEHHGSWITVVGVVENSVDRDIREPAGPFAYLAFDQWLAGKASIATDPAHLFVRGRAAAADLVPLVRGELRGLDPELPVYDIVPFEERAGALLMTQRMGLVLLGFFSTLALALSAVGMYGVASYVAASRTREIGIRMALGSSRREIGRLMLRHSARPLAAGLLLGLALALAAGRLAGAFLYGVDPHDPLTFGAGALLLAAVALLAAYVPARRASRADPMIALRVE